MLTKRQTFYKNFRKFGYFHHNTNDLKTIEKEVPGAIGEFQALNCFLGSMDGTKSKCLDSI